MNRTHENAPVAGGTAAGGLTPKEDTRLSRPILTDESVISEVFEASQADGVKPSLIVEMIGRRPEWADAYQIEVDDDRQTVVTYCREVGTVEIRQAFFADTWASAADESGPMIYFHSPQEAREQGLPSPEVVDVMRAVGILQECGECPCSAPVGDVRCAGVDHH